MPDEGPEVLYIMRTGTSAGMTRAHMGPYSPHVAEYEYEPIWGQMDYMDLGGPA